MQKIPRWIFPNIQVIIDKRYCVWVVIGCVLLAISPPSRPFYLIIRRPASTLLVRWGAGDIFRRRPGCIQIGLSYQSQCDLLSSMNSKRKYKLTHIHQCYAKSAFFAHHSIILFWPPQSKIISRLKQCLKERKIVKLIIELAWILIHGDGSYGTIQRSTRTQIRFEFFRF